MLNKVSPHAIMDFVALCTKVVAFIVNVFSKINYIHIFLTSLIYEGVRTAILFFFSYCLWFLKAFPFPIETKCDLLRHGTLAFCLFVIVA